MKFGVCVPNYGATLSVQAIQAVALEAEKLGYDSVWTTDHVLMPKDSGTPYERILDSLATLAYIASQTRKVKLGVSSLVIAMRNPVVVAKQLASIAAFAGEGTARDSTSRVLLAMSAGWNEKEFSFVGSDFHTRGKRADESIKLIRALWAGEEKFRSRRIPQNFENAKFEPKPNSDKLTIWIGGTSEAAMRRALDLGDAWHPNVLPLDAFRGLVKKFRGMSPDAKNKEICVRIAIDVRATQSEYVTSTQGERRIIFSKNMTENRTIISELEALGVSYVVLAPSPDGKVELHDQLESIRTFASEFMK